MANDPKLVASFLAAEKLLLTKLDDAEKVIYYQQRAMTAEEANKQLELEAQLGEIVKEFPSVEIDDIKGLKTVEEIKTVASRLQAKADKFKVTGQSEVEAAIKETLKLKDEEIADMRKVYGKARQPQAGDVTGSQIQAVQTAAAAGVGAPAKDDGTLEGSIRKGMGNMFERLGIGGN